MTNYDADAVPPPAYTPIPDDPFPTNRRASSSAQGLDERFRRLDITTPPVSNEASSSTTSTAASPNSCAQGTVEPRSSATRYLYYHIFSPKGIVKSKRSFTEDDPYTGRVPAFHITPPRTVRSIKIFLCDVEEISDIERVDLLASALTSESELSDQDRPPILSQDGFGSTADDPMALVIKNPPPAASNATHISPVSNPNQSSRSLLGSFSLTPMQLRHDYPVNSVTFSLDGKRIASGSNDSRLFIWDANTGKLTTDPIGAHSHIQSLAFSPNGKQIVSGFYKAPYIQIRDAGTGTIVPPRFEGHTGFVMSVSFSPDGRQIASGSYDNSIRIWEVQSGTVLQIITGHTTYVSSIAFSPDGLNLASGSYDHSIRVWNMKTGKLKAGPYLGHSDTVRSVAFCPNGRHIVSGSDDHYIRVWDMENGTGVSSHRSFQGHTKGVWSVAIGPGGHQIVSGSFDGTVRIWSFKTGEEVSILRLAHGEVSREHQITSMAVSPEGDCIVAGSAKGSIYWWKKG